MNPESRLRIALQKSGRLSQKSLSLIAQAGVDFDLRKEQLLHFSTNFPMDLMFVRDDDIPEYVVDGVCQLGVVGLNVIEEKYRRPDQELGADKFDLLFPLGFGACRLSIAVPSTFDYRGIESLRYRRIATSYPNCLKRYLDAHHVEASIVELSGSVEVAPSVRIADAVCDLVSTGATLLSNGLREVEMVLQSQAYLIRSKVEKNEMVTANTERFLRRIRGVLQAASSKYIMMNAPVGAVPKIREIIPGMEEPSILPLGSSGERVAIHAVSREDVFWETLEKLKAVGASSILVLPIEKVIA